jgi:hypothetical protein
MRATVLVVGGSIMVLGGGVLLVAAAAGLWRNGFQAQAGAPLLGSLGSALMGWRAVKRGLRERRMR